MFGQRCPVSQSSDCSIASAVQGEYVETSAGKTHTFSVQNVRYLREHLNDWTVSGWDHWVELEVFGSRNNVMIGDDFE